MGLTASKKQSNKSYHDHVNNDLELPEMVLTEVLMYLPGEDVLRAAAVCHRWYEPARSTYTWGRLLQRDFPATNVTKIELSEEVLKKHARLVENHKIYFFGMSFEKLKWDHNGNANFSENKKEAFKAKSSHVNIFATKPFSKGKHRWRVKLDGLDNMSYWIAVGCALNKAKVFSYDTVDHFGYSSTGNILGNVKNMPRTTDRWQNGDIVTVELDCKTHQLLIFQNDHAMPPITVLPLGSRDNGYWPWVNLYHEEARVTFLD